MKACFASNEDIRISATDVESEPWFLEVEIPHGVVDLGEAKGAHEACTPNSPGHQDEETDRQVLRQRMFDLARRELEMQFGAGNDSAVHEALVSVADAFLEKTSSDDQRSAEGESVETKRWYTEISVPAGFLQDRETEEAPACERQASPLSEEESHLLSQRMYGIELREALQEYSLEESTESYLRLLNLGIRYLRDPSLRVDELIEEDAVKLMAIVGSPPNAVSIARAGLAPGGHTHIEVPQTHSLVFWDLAGSRNLDRPEQIGAFAMLLPNIFAELVEERGQSNTTTENPATLLKELGVALSFQGDGGFLTIPKELTELIKEAMGRVKFILSKTKEGEIDLSHLGIEGGVDISMYFGIIDPDTEIHQESLLRVTETSVDVMGGPYESAIPAIKRKIEEKDLTRAQREILAASSYEEVTLDQATLEESCHLIQFLPSHFSALGEGIERVGVYLELQQGDSPLSRQELIQLSEEADAIIEASNLNCVFETVEGSTFKYILEGENPLECMQQIKLELNRLLKDFRVESKFGPSEQGRFREKKDHLFFSQPGVGLTGETSAEAYLDAAMRSHSLSDEISRQQSLH